MILTVTLNPSVDRRYIIEDFNKDGMYRVNNFQATPGGKGLNVAKVINNLGEEVITTGFLGGTSGAFIKESLDKLNIKNDFLKISGNTRTCIAILSNDGSQTEILESGPEINRESLDDFYRHFNDLICQAEIITISGSLPVGLKKDTYKELIKIGKKANKRIILDTSGEALNYGIEAKPFLIKPNQDELSRLVDFELRTQEDIIKALEKIKDFGVENILVSLGKEGAILASVEGVYKLDIPKVKAVNPVGSGDSLVAGMAVGLKRGYDMMHTVKLGSACGTANAMEEETGKVSVSNVEKILKQIEVRKLK